MSDLNKIIASILTSDSTQQLSGGNIEGIEGGKKKLPAKLRRWSKALMSARAELGITGFLAPKKSAPARSPQRKLYVLAKRNFDRSR
jgi:hypothetical protein